MLRYKVTGMSCGHCVNQITKAIQTHYPSANVMVNLNEQTVEVSKDEDLAKVAGLIAEAGYEVQESKFV